MPVQTILNSEHAALFYHEEEGIVHHRFYPLMDSAHLREVLDRGVELLHQHGAQKWLSDNSHMNPHDPEDGSWINENWLPRALAAGWKFWALVVPVEAASQMNLVEFVNTFWEMGVRIAVFTDPGDALNWLKQVSEAEIA